jgi:ribose 5-phosphate isomerase B
MKNKNYAQVPSTQETTKLTLVIGTDHRGFAHKEYLKKMLVISGISVQWIDVGAGDEKRSDYPVFARAAVQEMLSGRAQLGVLLCGSGVGMAIAANRYKKIYAALAWNEIVAQQSREDDNANILVLPADFVTPDQAVAMVQVWLQACFNGGRYQERVAMLDTLG